MKIEELIKILNKFPKNADFLVSSDEEFNTIFQELEVVALEQTPDKKISKVVIFGYTGSEVD